MKEIEAPVSRLVFAVRRLAFRLVELKSFSRRSSSSRIHVWTSPAFIVEALAQHTPSFLGVRSSSSQTTRGRRARRGVSSTAAQMSTRCCCSDASTLKRGSRRHLNNGANHRIPGDGREERASDCFSVEERVRRREGDDEIAESRGTVSRGLRENRTQEGTHRFYRFSHAAARPHAPFLSGGAVSIDQM